MFGSGGVDGRSSSSSASAAGLTHVLLWLHCSSRCYILKTNRNVVLYGSTRPLLPFIHSQEAFCFSGVHYLRIQI